MMIVHLSERDEWEDGDVVGEADDAEQPEGERERQDVPQRHQLAALRR